MLSKLLTRREQLVLLALAGGLLVGSVTLYVLRDAARPEVAEALTVARVQPSVSEAVRQVESHVDAKPEAPAAPVAVPVVAPVSVSVSVSVRGAVVLPGVYEFTQGARVREAVDRAGGALESADLSDLNLAARLLDGTTLTVPDVHGGDGRLSASSVRALPVNPPEYTISGWQPSPEAAGPAKSAGPAAQGGVLDLNTASEAELESLPGIGPKLASQIVQYRAGARFTCVEDIQEVSGIGPKKLESIRPFVTVR